MGPDRRLAASASLPRAVRTRANEKLVAKRRVCRCHGHPLAPLERRSTSRDITTSVDVTFDARHGRRPSPCARHKNPAENCRTFTPRAKWWPLAMARELDDAILMLRTNELEIGTALLKTRARCRCSNATSRCWGCGTIGLCARHWGFCVEPSHDSMSPHAACSRSWTRDPALPAPCSSWPWRPIVSTCWRCRREEADAPIFRSTSFNFGCPAVNGRTVWKRASAVTRTSCRNCARMRRASRSGRTKR